MNDSYKQYIAYWEYTTAHMSDNEWFQEMMDRLKDTPFSKSGYSRANLEQYVDYSLEQDEYKNKYIAELEHELIVWKRRVTILENEYPTQWFLGMAECEICLDKRNVWGLVDDIGETYALCGKCLSS